MAEFNSKPVYIPDDRPSFPKFWTAALIAGVSGGILFYLLYSAGIVLLMELVSIWSR